MHLLQIDFRLAKQGWMKDFAGKWTIQPLNEHDSKHNLAGNSLSQPPLACCVTFCLVHAPQAITHSSHGLSSHCNDSSLTACIFHGSTPEGMSPLPKSTGKTVDHIAFRWAWAGKHKPLCFPVNELFDYIGAINPSWVHTTKAS